VSRSAALLSNAARDRPTGLVTGHQAGFDGIASTRGGLGAVFCAMIGKYSKAMELPLSCCHYYWTRRRQSTVASDKSELRLGL
jgi:hypothetical protein